MRTRIDYEVCERLDRKDLIGDPRFDSNETMMANAAVGADIIRGEIVKYTLDERVEDGLVVARAMTLRPNLLFVSEPTRGIDVGAKQRVLEILAALNRDDGVSLVVTSSELAELRAISDRVAIVYRGKIAAVLPPDASDADFGLAMAGESVKAA